jgi:hypothetical protein
VNPHSQIAKPLQAPIADMPDFYGHPEAREAVNINFEYKEAKNPALRGITLVIGAWVYVLGLTLQ